MPTSATRERATGRTFRAIASILVFQSSRFFCAPDLATGKPFWLLMMAMRQLQRAKQLVSVDASSLGR